MDEEHEELRMWVNDRTPSSEEPAVSREVQSPTVDRITILGMHSPLPPPTLPNSPESNNFEGNPYILAKVEIFPF
jgi:hypothetical protein